ncbi:hypothetical protein V6N11_049564 [Hibiscus sabdariffa]|uniref:Uncharacterized protein n=1 Tax=Hibiscus sabdariffa TaxID=183260 RepID=A0ABR2NMR8_9ROSI
MRPSPDCRPAVGAYGPQGHVSWAQHARRTSRSSRPEAVALLPRSTEIQPFVASIRPSPRIHFSFYSINVWGSTVDVICRELSHLGGTQRQQNLKERSCTEVAPNEETQNGAKKTSAEKRTSAEILGRGRKGNPIRPAIGSE